MALPKIDAPIYNLTLPLSKKQIQYRPFLVKEQKTLLMAMEADDSETIEQNIRQVLVNCTVTKDIDIDSLPIIDVEYYFLNLRAKSVGEIVENRYKCNNLVDGVECGKLMDVKLNILDIKPVINEKITNNIQITPKISVQLNYPQFNLIKRAGKFNSATDLAFDMIAESIESIYDGEQYYYAKESTPQELIDFIESLNTEQFKKIEEFFENLPVLNKTVEIKCPKCGYDHKIDVEGLENFFA